MSVMRALAGSMGRPSRQIVGVEAVGLGDTVSRPSEAHGMDMPSGAVALTVTVARAVSVMQ